MKPIDENKVWQFVEPSDLKLPEKPASAKARSFLRKFYNNLFSENEEDKSVDVQSELRSVPQKLLEWVAPYPEWSEPAQELMSLIHSWAKELPGSDFFRIIVSPPGGGHGEILQALAEQESWPIVPGPDFPTLLSRDYSWIEKIERSNESPLVIPRLERLFLRHANGLEHIRQFFEKMFHVEQHCLIGCNSWLWKYLEVAMHIGEGLSSPYFLQSMNARALDKFFCSLESQKGENSTVFRQSNNGSFVLPFAETAEGKLDKDLIAEYQAEEDDFPSLFIKKLARQSRGIPLVAWAIWRNSLNLAPASDVADEAKDAAHADLGKTIWVKSFDEIVMPQIHHSPGQLACFLLQFLILHDGLPPEIIYELLDFDKDEVISLLHKFKKIGIVVAERGLWRVSWQGYPEVRNFLDQQDYLLDSM